MSSLDTIATGASFRICGMSSSTSPDIDRYFEALDHTGFGGEIRRDLATRIVHATDNSIYQFLPAAVVHVRWAEDVARMLRLGTEDRFRALSFSARGGGTGTNAQSLTTGIVVDCSKYLNRIHEINPEEGWVEVEPGVILDRLNGVLKPHGLFFAPNVSTSSRATIGGMISTDACGQGSRQNSSTATRSLRSMSRAGMPSANVASAKCVTVTSGQCSSTRDHHAAVSSSLK